MKGSESCTCDRRSNEEMKYLDFAPGVKGVVPGSGVNSIGLKIKGVLDGMPSLKYLLNGSVVSLKEKEAFRRLG